MDLWSVLRLVCFEEDLEDVVLVPFERREEDLYTFLLSRNPLSSIPRS